MKGTISGVTMAPILVPALKMPVASARSFFGNQSVTALMPPRKAADSPRPSATRARMKWNVERAAVRHVRDGPERESGGEAPFRADAVNKAAPDDVEESVGRLGNR